MNESLSAPLVPRDRAPVCCILGSQHSASHLVLGTCLYDISKTQGFWEVQVRMEDLGATHIRVPP